MSLLPASAALRRSAAGQELMPVDARARVREAVALEREENAARERDALPYRASRVDPDKHPLALNTAQAAARLGVSRGTIRRWAALGNLEHWRTENGQRRFSEEGLQRYLDSLQRGPER